MCDVRDREFNEELLLEGVGDNYLEVDEEQLLKKFQDTLDEIERQKLDQNNKNEQYQDPVDDNVYASHRDPIEEVEVKEEEVQTNQEKTEGQKASQ